MKTILTVLVLASSLVAYADHHEKDKMGHDKEHQHVKMDKKDHEHDPAHHKAHDHKAHHPDHKEEAPKKP
jgi:Ni/Co efflux regulator RcnB